MRRRGSRPALPVRRRLAASPSRCVRLTGRPVLSSGLRQLALGALAVAITYGVGTLIGHHAG
jgi:vacuolar iron transporter family protein